MFDPIYLFLRYLVLRDFFKTSLGEAEQAFLHANIKKHRAILWLNIIASVFICIGLRQAAHPETLISALIAPVMVMGAAWFAISFGGVPTKLLHIAMKVTFWMFTAFLLSLTAMFLAVALISPWWIWFPLAVIYYGALVSSIMYDTTDGLKVGLDEAVLKHSRAALQYYAQQGVKIEEEKR